MKNMLQANKDVNKACNAASLYCTHRSKGFTLIELVVVIMIIAILAAIMMPMYQDYIRRATLAQTQDEMQRLAEQLERHRAKNFSYRGFNPAFLYTGSTAFNAATQTLSLPIGETTVKYTITIVDSTTGNPLLTATAATGQGWAMIATVNNDPKNYNLLFTSAGLKCKNKASIADYTGCGTGGETW